MRTAEVTVRDIPYGSEVTMGPNSAAYLRGLKMEAKDPGINYSPQSQQRIPLVNKPEDANRHSLTVSMLPDTVIEILIEEEVLVWLAPLVSSGRAAIKEACKQAPQTRHLHLVESPKEAA